MRERETARYIDICMYTCMYVCMYVCVYIYIYICICMRTSGNAGARAPRRAVTFVNME